MFEMEKLKELKSKAMVLQPTVQIGKNGLTETVIEEIKKQLKDKKLIKIKFLKGALEAKDKKELAKEIVEKTNSKAVLFVGFSLTIYK